MISYRNADEGMIVRGCGPHSGKVGVIEKVFAPAPLGMYQRIEVRWSDRSSGKAFRDEIRPVTIDGSTIDHPRNLSQIIDGE